MTDTWHSTKAVCERLGITPERLREYRDTLGLAQPADWRPHHSDRRSVIYSPAALEKLAMFAAGRPAEGAEPEPATTPPENAGDTPTAQPEPALMVVEELEVVSSPRLFPTGRVQHFPNPRVIRAKRASGELVYVRVPESAHFVQHLQDGAAMRIKARLDGEPPTWSLVGRCPRAPGRW